MKVRFYLDPETGQPHVHNHGVSEEEVRRVLAARGEDRAAGSNTRFKMGQSTSGRFLRVVYAPDREPGSVFVITAYELRVKELKAHRRYMRRRSR